MATSSRCRDGAQTTSRRINIARKIGLRTLHRLTWVSPRKICMGYASASRIAIFVSLATVIIILIKTGGERDTLIFTALEQLDIQLKFAICLWIHILA